MTTTPPPFRPWRRALGERGFSPAATGGRRGLYMTRREGPVTTAVGAMLHDRRADELCVVLHVSHPFPFADPPHDVVLVSGDLTEEGVRIEEPGPPRPGATTWWPAEAAERAWAALEAHGLPWLERFSRPDVLIEHFEAGLEPRGVVESLRRLVRPDAAPPPPRRDFLLWLALLHEGQGEVERAREALGRWVAAGRAEGARRGDVLERVERRLQALHGTGAFAEGMAREEFLARFGPVWSRVFSGRPVREGAFADEEWEAVLLPDPRFEPEPERTAWLEAVTGTAGDALCVFSEDESEDRHAVNAVTPAHPEGITDALTRTDLAHVYAYLTALGPSGRWGLVVEEHFACLAGDRAFMDAYARAAGGREALRARFLAWADTEWQGSDRHLAAVLARVGWDAPGGREG